MFKRRLRNQLLGSNGVFGNLLFPFPRLVKMRIGGSVADRLHKRSKPPQVSWSACAILNGLRVSHNGAIVNADHPYICLTGEEARIR